MLQSQFIGSAHRRTVGATILAIAAALAHSQLSFAAGDAAHGERIYRQCMACHTLDKNAIGPKHRDVFGRKAGSVADFDYSAALKGSSIVWDERRSTPG